MGMMLNEVRNMANQVHAGNVVVCLVRLIVYNNK